MDKNSLAVKNGRGQGKPPDTLAFNNALDWSILQAVSYADVFDYPLSPEEIQHNLVGHAASLRQVTSRLVISGLLARCLAGSQGYFHLPGRESTLQTRRRRSQASAELWPKALAYGRLLARMPFVRMVGLTGALAVHNAQPDDDIDYLIVTEVGRLWLCRAMIILLVKLAERRGDVICPNYFLSTDALALPDHDLFTAHELLQMKPLFGFAVYRRMLAFNAWAGRFLPNAFAAQTGQNFQPESSAAVKQGLEKALRLPPLDRLERWELERKVAKFGRRLEALRPSAPGNGQLIEVSFSANCCKGHFHQHGRHTLDTYQQSIARLYQENNPHRAWPGNLPAAEVFQGKGA